MYMQSYTFNKYRKQNKQFCCTRNLTSSHDLEGRRGTKVISMDEEKQIQSNSLSTLPTSTQRSTNIQGETTSHQCTPINKWPTLDNGKDNIADGRTNDPYASERNQYMEIRRKVQQKLTWCLVKKINRTKWARPQDLSFPPVILETAQKRTFAFLYFFIC